jgi:hypothetical protein
MTQRLDPTISTHRAWRLRLSEARNNLWTLLAWGSNIALKTLANGPISFNDDWRRFLSLQVRSLLKAIFTFLRGPRKLSEGKQNPITLLHTLSVTSCLLIEL